MKIPVQLIILLILIFNSCAVKKRSYRDGYYISWNHKNKHSSQPVTKTHDHININNTEYVKEKEVNHIHESSFASVNDEIAPVKQKPKWNFFKDTCGDLITLRKGAEVKARVLEINETQVKYKRCDNLDGPLIIINKNDVYSIKYSNGVLEFFEKTNPAINNTNTAKTVHPLAYVTLGCTIGIILLSVISLVAALIVGTIARREILKNPGKYEGLEMVNVCMTICWILLILAIALIALVVFLL